MSRTQSHIGTEAKSTKSPLATIGNQCPILPKIGGKIVIACLKISLYWKRANFKLLIIYLVDNPFYMPADEEVNRL